MAISIKDLLTVSSPAALRGTTYELGPILLLENMHGYGAYLIDRQTGKRVALAWSLNDEELQDTDTKRIDFVANLLENAIRLMEFDMEDEPEDVIFTKKE